MPRPGATSSATRPACSRAARRRSSPGGSLYWVIRGVVLCRTPIADLVPVTGKDGIERCRIEFKHQVVPVQPIPRRAFQGWRYFKDEDAPRDLPKGERGKDIPPKMRKELIELGLL